MPRQKLKRTLRLFEVVFFATGVIIGAGIYAVIGEAAVYGGNALWLSFLVSALTATLTAFSYSELCALYPSAGGEFEYVKSAIGKKLALVIGPMVAFTGIVAGATISVAFAQYLGEVVEVSSRLASLCIIAFILFVNITGIRLSSGLNIAFTLIEITGLLFVIFAAVPHWGKVDYLQFPEGGIHSLLTAAAISFFAFTGFEDAVKLAEETKNPERNIPRGLFIATGIVVLIYMAVSISAVSLVSSTSLGGQKSPLLAIADSAWGRTGVVFLSLVALFSTSNSLLSNMLGSSRVFYAMGNESRKLKWLGSVSRKRQTPVKALLLATSIMVLFALIGKIKTVALITNFFAFGTFLLINVTVLYLRYKEPGLKRPFRIPLTIGWVPLLPVLAIIMILLMVAYGIRGLL